MPPHPLLYTGNAQHAKPEESIASIESGFIQQMTEENLLISEKDLNLMDVVGQGTTYL